MLNNILPRPEDMKYLTLLDSSLGYHYLKPDDKFSYISICLCPFGRYQIIQLLFEEATVEDMFKKKIHELFSGMPNVFGNSDDILLAGFDEQDRDHDKMMEMVLQTCRQSYLKLNKDRCLFRCISIPFFSKIVSWQALSPDPSKI